MATIARGDLATIWPGAARKGDRMHWASLQRRVPPGVVMYPVLAAALERLAPEYLDQRTAARIPYTTLGELARLGWHICRGMWREDCFVRVGAPTPEGYTRRTRWRETGTPAHPSRWIADEIGPDGSTIRRGGCKPRGRRKPKPRPEEPVAAPPPKRRGRPPKKKTATPAKKRPPVHKRWRLYADNIRHARDGGLGQNRVKEYAREVGVRVRFSPSPGGGYAIEIKGRKYLLSGLRWHIDRAKMPP
jgi:hypothetical protein